MKVTLVYSPEPRQVRELELELPEGVTLQDALVSSGWLSDFPELASGEEVTCGIWGRKAERGALVRDLDRIEFYRALRVDPKVARRERFNSQGSRRAGLFAQRRPGAKPGY